MKDIKTGLYIYIILDVIVFAVSLFFGWKWIVNSQIAFFGAFGIVLLSFLAYLKNINKQIKIIGDIIDDKDIIDEMDDPYELYEENDKNTSNKKSKIKISVKNLKKSKSAAFSLSRVIGYALFIGSFLLLVKTDSFLIIPYIIGISIIPLGGLLNIIYQRKFNGN